MISNTTPYALGIYSSQILIGLDIVHCWFVAQREDELTRVEILGPLGSSNENRSSLTYSSKHFYEGLKSNPLSYINPFLPSTRFETNEIATINGYRESLADKMSQFILERSQEYPFLHFYEPYPSPGPNSNTFIQWVLNNFSYPSNIFQLPQRAHGKDYMIAQNQ